MDVTPVIETARLVLRPPAAEDLPGWTALMGDAEAARFIGGLQPPTGAWRGLATMAGCWALHGFGMFSVLESASGRWIGRVGPWRPLGWPGNEIGWGLLRDAWGKGYAQEATEAATGWAFDRLGWTEIIHLIHPENARSRALAERIGSRRLGTTLLPPPFEPQEHELWGQSAAEWRARRMLARAATPR